MPRFTRRHPVLTFALAVGMTTAGANDLETALDANDWVTAEPLLEALVIDWQRTWETNKHTDDAKELGSTLLALGIVERQLGKGGEALPHLENAVLLLGEADAEILADALEALALTQQDLGKAAAAESNLRKVIQLRQTLPADKRETSLRLGLDHLALNLLVQGKYREAGTLIQSTLAGTPPAETGARARRLGYLGRYLHTLGSNSRAAAAFREALALPVKDPELRLSLRSQLALSELRLGKIDEARLGIEDSATEARRLYRDPASMFRAAPYLNNLGALDLKLGNPTQARHAFAESFELLEQSLGPDHPSLIVPLNNLGCTDQALGRYREADASLQRAADLQARHLPRLHLRVAETARNQARNALLAGDPDARDEIERATGIGVELLDDLIQQGSEQERLNFLQLLDLVSLPCATEDPSRIADVLIASKARLLDAMLVDAKAKRSPSIGWQQVQATLRPGMAFVDTCRYLPAESGAEARYGAIVLLPEGPPKWIPLGNAAELDRWLEAFRKRLAWCAGMLAGETTRPPPLTLQGILRALHAGFWEPVARALPAGTEHVAFSPDGGLHFLPLPALLDRDLRPLCHHHLQVTTVSSGRDLLNPPPAQRLDAVKWLGMGVSDFPKRKGAPGEDPLMNLLAGLGPMPGTAEEIRRIKRLAPRGSKFHLDAAVNETALAGLKDSPGVLHLGCHAFFLPTATTRGAVMDFDENAGLLLAGGLLLHRAALRGPECPLLDDHDDLMFPCEVAELPLQGTRLVTLSSCESGAGTLVSGEGVLGLRRGFALAGAREVVVALWQVSDRSTPAFMERFYHLALASDRPAQALWQTQREFLATATNGRDFEIAVLRYCPFILSQNFALAAGGEIVAPPLETGFPWRWTAISLPLLAYFAARCSRGKPAA
jgi:CHAT domain-containing protein/tetratricopeptide (TPR) repeat protein